MRPHPRRARTDPTSPRAWATSDRNGMVGNQKNLRWQMQWAGTGLINTRILVFDDEYDIPQRQLGTIILPPDPVAITNARPEQYYVDEYAGILFEVPQPANFVGGISDGGGFAGKQRFAPATAGILAEDNSTPIALEFPQYYDTTAVEPPTPSPGPNILSLSPTSGDISGGTLVTITGTSFLGATSVKFGGNGATSYTVVNNTTITATTPAGTFGLANVSVTTVHGTGIGVNLFNYTAWYSAYEIGGTIPLLFADFTTEGGTDHYLYNGNTYTGEAAWLSALGGTFSRSSSAYYTNASGVLASAANNVLRFDYSPTSVGTPLGILLEGASTNLLLSSGDMQSSGEGNTVATWVTQATTATLSGTAPDGVGTATEIVPTAGTGDHERFQATSVTNGQTYTYSIFVKNGTAGWIGIYPSNGSTFDPCYFNLSTGAIGNVHSGYTASIVAYRNGWYRVSVTYTTSSTTADPTILPCTANGASFNWNAAGTESVYVWGAQFENMPFASSYIPTTSGSATRSADSLTATPITAWYKASAGTLLADGDTQGSYNPATPNGGDFIQINDAGNNNVITLVGSVTTASQGWLGAVYSGGVAQLDVQEGFSGQVGYTAGVAAIAAVSAQASGFIYVKGTGTPQTAGAGSMPVSPTELQIGAGLFNPLFGHVRNFGYWPVAATQAQLQSLTSGTP